MKKIFAILVAILAFSFAGYAQLLTANTYTRKARSHNVWFDISAGSLTTSVIGSDTKVKGNSLGLSLRWTKPFGDIFCWDFFDLGTNMTFPTSWSENDPDPCFYLMTGPRVRYEVVENLLHVYAAADAGVGAYFLQNYDLEEPKVGLITELSAGVMLKKRFHVGAYLRNYPTYKEGDSGIKFSSVGAKLGFSF